MKRQSVLPRLVFPSICALALMGCKGGDADGDAAKSSNKASAKKDGAKKAKTPTVSAAQVLERAKKLFSPLPEVAQSPKNPVTEEKVALGRMLYFDERLSKNHDLSCNTCHDLANYGIDIREKDGKRVATSPGHKEALGERNSPTVYNAAIQLSQFWDGRSPDVEDQAKGPILNAVEMAMPHEDAVLTVLRSIPGYEEAFKVAFPEDAEPITYDNLAKAIGAFERKLMTPAPFDEFLAGNMGALNPQQLRGLQLFMDVGCTTCHTGPGLGGTMYQKLGSVKPWETEDVGRFEVTKVEADRFVFKVPVLRNITKTGPYMHDGTIDSLQEMVAKMTEHQTAKGTLNDEEMASILAFLDALTGPIPETYIQRPQLPENGPTTPAPDPA